MPRVGARFLFLMLAAALAWPARAQRRGTSPSASARMTPAATETFRLSAGPCAAKGYPMTIQVGNFVLADGGTFPVPSGHHLEGKWGLSSRSWAVGDERQPVPVGLEILYFSYAEDKFYEGEFPLPADQIRARLREGFWDFDAQQRATYTKFTVCVLPKGAVVVWLTGAGQQVLVGRFQAREAAADFHRFYPESDRVAMFREERAALPPAVQAQVAGGTVSARQWDGYLLTYPWQLAFNQPLKLTHYNAAFLNGERTSYPVTADRGPYLQYLLGPEAKAVPERWSLHVTDEAGHRHVLRVEPFDEAETQAAFRTLHHAAPAKPITLRVETDKYLKKAALVLECADKQIPLTKSPVRVIAAD